MKTIKNKKTAIRNLTGFTLIELLVVISIIGVLAGMTIPALGMVKRQQYLKTARAELERIESALENYKAKYGVYPPSNQNTYTSPQDRSQFSQLYYELSGTTNTGSSFVTLDGSSSIEINPAQQVNAAYGVDGFINCTKGSGEDAVSAKDFLSGLKENQLNRFVTNNSIQTTAIITSVGGADANYHPMDPAGASGPNPFRYVYPGTNNPGSYDLWVQLVIRGKTNLICNWSRQVIINSSLP